VLLRWRVNRDMLLGVPGIHWQSDAAPTLVDADSSCDNVLRTAMFDTIKNKSVAVKWPHPYDSVGTLPNKTMEEWDGRPPLELRRAMDKADLLEWYRKCREISNTSIVQVLLGEGVGEIDCIEGAYKITLRIEQEAIDTINRLRLLHVNNY
jgi:hypothetical protein